MNDITITDPAGALCPNNFSGTFDGNGHTIKIVYSNLSSTELQGGCGFLFKDLVNATIRNLTIRDANFTTGTASNQYATLARRASGTVLIENVHVLGATITDFMTPNANVGGLLGDTDDGAEVTLRNCSFHGTISSIHTTGGLIGRLGTSRAQSKSVTIENCTVKGWIATSGAEIGGMVGLVNVSNTCEIRNCTNEAEVIGSALASGFVGSVTNGNVTLSGCTNKGVITGATKDAFVASGTATKTNCTDLSVAQ